MVTTRENQPLLGSIKTIRSVKYRPTFERADSAPEWANSIAQFAAAVGVIHGGATVTTSTIEGSPDGMLTIHTGGVHVELTEADATALAAAIIEHLLVRNHAAGDIRDDDLRSAALGIIDGKVPGLKNE